MKINQRLLSYCKHSTIHGLHYVYRSNNWFDRTLWIAALVFFSIVSLGLSRKIWLDYSFEPIITTVQDAFYPVRYIPFPSVVVCSNSLLQFDSPWAMEATKIIKSYGFSDKVLNDFFRTLSNPLISMTHEKEIVNIHQILYHVGIYKSYNEVLRNIQKPCNELLLQCVWGSVPYDCGKIFYFVNTRSGLCCRFDVSYLRINATEQIDRNTRTGVMDGNSLKMVLNGEFITTEGESIDSITRIYILSEKERVSILHKSVHLAPRASYDILLNVHEIIASDYVKKLSYSFRKCTLPEKDHMPYYKTCVTNALLEYVIQHCNCIPMYVTNPYSIILQNCSWDQYRCIANQAVEFLSNSSEKNLYQSCERQCEEVVYSPHIKYTKWTQQKRSTNNTSNEWFSEDKRYLEVNVRFESLTCFRYIRHALYTWEQMLANLGGAFGLGIGGSLISGIEIVWLTATIIGSLLRNVWSTKRMKVTAQKEPKLTNACENNELPAISGIPFAY